MKPWVALFVKDIRLELRQPQFLLAVVFFQFCLIFLFFLFHEPALSSVWWANLFWVNLLIAALSLTLKNFSSETAGQYLYFYQLTDPITLYLAKGMYNTALIFIVAIINFILFQLLFDSMPLFGWNFFVITFVGVVVISFTLTMVSYMSGYSDHAAVLINILSIPVLIPLMLLLIRSTIELAETRGSAGLPDLPLIAGIGALTLAMALGLFPYLWRR